MAELYTETENRLRVQQTGLYISGTDNEEIIPYSNIIKIEKYENARYYLKIVNRYDELADYSIEFVDIEEEIDRNNQRIIFNASIQGLMWLMILFGLFLFILLRDRVYLHYSLYVFFTAAYFFLGFVLGYQLFPNLSREIFIYTDILILIGYCFYIDFVRGFVDMRLNYPLWNRLFNLIQIVLIVSILAISIGHSMSSCSALVVKLQSIPILIVTVLAAGFIIRVFISGNIFSRLIGIGTSFLIIGMIISDIMMFMAGDMYTASSFVGFKLGVIIELIIFTFGISYRFWLIEKDEQATQLKLIDQLNKNASLQTKVNRELEQKVKERTTEISGMNSRLIKQNEALSAQKDEILVQRDELEVQRDIVASKRKRS